MYEYKIVSGLAKTRKDKSIDWSELEKRLNAFVTEGWEVVSSNTTTYGLWGSGRQEKMTTFVLRKSDES